MTASHARNWTREAADWWRLATARVPRETGELAMLCALNKIASRQAKPTDDLMTDVHRFLQYAASFPNGQLVYKASKMKLFIHSDASYLSESGSRSRAGGFPYLGDTEHSHNGSLGSISQIMPNALSSVGDASYKTSSSTLGTHRWARSYPATTQQRPMPQTEQLACANCKPQQ